MPVDGRPLKRKLIKYGRFSYIMKDLEPKIYRQRLTIEAKYEIIITEEIIKDFLIKFAKEIKRAASC